MCTTLGTDTLRLWKLGFKITLLVVLNNKSSNKHFMPLMCTILGADTLRLWKLYYTTTLLVVLNKKSGNKHFRPLMCTTLGTATLRLWKLYYRNTLLVILNNKPRLKTYYKNTSYLWCAPLWVPTPYGYEQDNSTCSLELQVKIKNLYHNTHFMPLMCITLGADTLRLWKLYYRTTLLAVLNNKSRWKTYIIKHFTPFMCTTLSADTLRRWKLYKTTQPGILNN